MLRRSRHQSGEAGTALTEFAIALLLILTVLFGIIEAGRCLYSYHWVSNAARLGSRYAMVRGACSLGTDGCTDCSSGTLPCEAYLSDIQNYIQNYAIGINWNNVTVTSTCIAGEAVNPSPPCAPAQPVQVKVQYNFSFITPLISRLVPGGGWTMTGFSQRTVVQNN